MRALELRIPPAVIGLFVGVMMSGAARFSPTFQFSLPGRQFIGAGLALAGLTIAVLGVLGFRRARTTVNPMNPAAASQLVVSGIYRRTRNPMYLGMLLVLLGWGTCLANALSIGLAAVFIPLMNRLQIGPEERMLTRNFGTAFDGYRAAVRRWL